MKKCLILLLGISIFPKISFSQLYFPPTTGSTWETMSPADLNWCPERIDSLYEYLDSKNTKAFIVLKDGKIVLERYFDDHTVSSNWYWASAGKTLTAFLIGIAQQEQHLSIQEPSLNYLGTGWSSCTPEQEQAITIWHHLTMTTGLDDGVAEPNCTLPSCLQFLMNPGLRWAYHNGPYTILDQVIENATGQTLNQYCNQKLKNPTGMDGLFIQVDNDNVFFSTARSMARFGLLMLNGGTWNTTAVMEDQVYLNEMINTSQNLNESYGYLWWLNGKNSFMLPGLEFVFPGTLMPNAPSDLYAGMGKNGQFLNVVPSQNLVLIRMGEEPEGLFVPNYLNDSIWVYMNQLECAVSLEEFQKPTFHFYPNPTADFVYVEGKTDGTSWVLVDLLGREIKRSRFSNQENRIDLLGLPAQLYVLKLLDEEGRLLAVEKIKKL